MAPIIAVIWSRLALAGVTVAPLPTTHPTNADAGADDAQALRFNAFSVGFSNSVLEPTAILTCHLSCGVRDSAGYIATRPVFTLESGVDDAGTPLALRAEKFKRSIFWLPSLTINDSFDLDLDHVTAATKWITLAGHIEYRRPTKIDEITIEPLADQTVSINGVDVHFSPPHRAERGWGIPFEAKPNNEVKGDAFVQWGEAFTSAMNSGEGRSAEGVRLSGGSGGWSGGAKFVKGEHRFNAEHNAAGGEPPVPVKLIIKFPTETEIVKVPVAFNKLELP